MDRDIRTVEDVLKLLDGLFAPEADRWTAGGASWWDGFYGDRDRPVPFFAAKPDETLVSYLDRGLITPGRALDLGCGPGRNALHLARAGFTVDAVDLSPQAIGWAGERVREAGEDRVRFHCGDAFALTGTTAATALDATPLDSTALDSTASSGEGPAAPLSGPYDLVYDSGCFHHLPPHRRISYLALIARTLAPGGHFALSCFAAGAMGSELADADFYRGSGLQGGLAYTPQSLRRIFAGLTEVELRRMRDEPPQSASFGEPFLWSALFRRPAAPAA